MYVYSASGNVISRDSNIHGSRCIINHGNSVVETGTIIRGDLNHGKPIIKWGHHCIFGEKCSIQPPERDGRRFPCVIGNFVAIGRESFVEAAQIGSYVVIGDGCKVGRFAILKDGVVVRPGTHIPPFAVVSPLTLVGPGASEDLPGCAPVAIERYCRELHAGIDSSLVFLQS